MSLCVSGEKQDLEHGKRAADWKDWQEERWSPSPSLFCSACNPLAQRVEERDADFTGRMRRREKENGGWDENSGRNKREQNVCRKLKSEEKTERKASEGRGANKRTD